MSTKQATIKLDAPVEFTGEDGTPVLLTEVIIRRPKVGDIRTMNEAIEQAGGRMSVDPVSGKVEASSISNAAQMAGTIALVAAMNRVPVSAIEDLDFEDFAKVTKALPGFMPAEAEATGGA